MFVHLNIIKTPIINDSNVRYWIIEHCNKWIISSNVTHINVICVTKIYTRLDSVLRALNCSFIKFEKKREPIRENPIPKLKKQFLKIKI
jgi:hypothetical protein